MPVFTTLAKLQGVMIGRFSNGQFIYSTIYKDIVNYRPFVVIAIQCVVKKKGKGKGNKEKKSIGFLIKSESGHLHKFITTSSAKVPAKIAEHANISKYYEKALRCSQNGMKQNLPIVSSYLCSL